MSQVLISLFDDSDRAIVFRSVASLASHTPRYVDQVSREEIAGIICDSKTVATMAALIRGAAQRGARVILWSRAVSRGDLNAFLALSSITSNVDFWVGMGLKSPGAAIRLALTQPDAGPLAEVMREVPADWGTETSRLILGAIALTRSHRTVDEYAALFGLAPRTLQLHHVRAQLPPPKRLLQTMRAIWTLWRIDRWGLSCKQAADAGEYSSAAAQSAATRLALNRAPRIILKDTDVGSIVGGIVIRLHGVPSLFPPG